MVCVKQIRRRIQLLMWKMALAMAWAVFFCVEVSAEDAVLFKFVPGRLMFYYHYCENSTSIAKADSLINANFELISSGKAVVGIRGFCTSWPTEAQNRVSAKNRSNQVKSWYIIHSGMKEDWFRTENSTRPDTLFTENCGDVVALLYIEYLQENKEKQTERPSLEPLPQGPDMSASQESEITRSLSLPVPCDMTSGFLCVSGDRPAEEMIPQTPARQTVAGTGSVKIRKPLKFNVKTNMLYDVAGFPSLEIEIPTGYRWSFNFEGSLAWWSSYRKNNFYQLDLLSPEVRWWFGQKSRWHGHYIGVFGMVGLYDLEWKGGRGYQGEYWSAGLSYGYMFPIACRLSLEAGIGLGFLQTGYEEYLPQDGHYVYQQTSRTNYFGPVKLKLGLVWRIGDTPSQVQTNRQQRRAGK